jgi:hypothetical protein
VHFPRTPQDKLEEVLDLLSRAQHLISLAEKQIDPTILRLDISKESSKALQKQLLTLEGSITIINKKAGTKTEVSTPLDSLKVNEPAFHIPVTVKFRDTFLEDNLVFQFLLPLSLSTIKSDEYFIVLRDSDREQLFVTRKRFDLSLVSSGQLRIKAETAVTPDQIVNWINSALKLSLSWVECSVVN